jgi:aminoglycoside 6'-N-acetyltransferase
MDILPALEKVTAFITRGGMDGPQLLCFRHPKAGLQLPAGTVEPGEALGQAACREAAEETGLTHLGLIGQTGEWDEPFVLGQVGVLTPAFLLGGPEVDALPVGTMLWRGLPVTLLERQGDMAHVAYREYDFSQEPWGILSEVTGWIPFDHLAGHMHRRGFHLECLEDTPSEWDILSDRGLTFHPVWLPLDPRPPLVWPQALWLAYAPTPNAVPFTPLPALEWLHREPDGDTGQGGSLTLRKLRPDLADMLRMAKWLTDPRVLEFYEGRDNPQPLEKVRQVFDPETRAEKGETPCLMVLGGQPVGYMQFYRVDEEMRQRHTLAPEGAIYGIDLFIGEPELWGRGLGARATRLLVDYLFEVCQAVQVILDPHVENERAIRTYRKCGFQDLGILPAHELHEGRWADCLLLGISR